MLLSVSIPPECRMCMALRQLCLAPIPRKDKAPTTRPQNMDKGNGRDNDPLLEQTKQLVERLQDQILEITDNAVRQHPECDPQAFVIAVGQAFVAQSLKTYGVQGFTEARKLSQLIIDTMERAMPEEDSAS